MTFALEKLFEEGRAQVVLGNALSPMQVSGQKRSHGKLEEVNNPC